MKQPELGENVRWRSNPELRGVVGWVVYHPRDGPTVGVVLKCGGGAQVARVSLDELEHDTGNVLAVF